MDAIDDLGPDLNVSATGVIRGANGAGPEPLVDAGIVIAAGDEQAAADYCDQLLDGDNDDVRQDLDNCPEVANTDQADSDGDGVGDACDLVDNTDADGDGYIVGEDCNDADATINPGATDIPGNGIDENCDGVDAAPIAASVAGQVLNSAGEPVVGATVCVDETAQCATSVDGGYYAIGGVLNGDYTVTATAFGYESQSAPVSVAGGVNGSANFALVPVGASVNGQVFDDTGAPIVGATITVNESGQSTTSVDGGYYAIGGVVNGTYTVTASADGYTPVTLDATVAGENVLLDFTLTAAAVEPVPATLSAELCLAIGADADGVVVQADIDAAITAGLLDPVVDADLIVLLLGGACAEFVAPVEPTTGLVDVFKAYCDDIEATEFNGDAFDDDCVPGAATFSFYLIGDDTADYTPLTVWEDGFGSVELEAGSYEVVEEGTQATTTIDVVAGETTSLTVANPGVAPAPRDGTVNISVFTCNNIDEVIFTSDGFMVMALPTFEPACEPGAATLTFYLVGDGTADYTQIDVDGTGTLTLAPGTYEVVEEGTQASTFITVFAGDFITLDVQIPAGGEVVPGSSVNVVKFYCDTVTETEFLALNAAQYSERDELPGSPDCVSGYATFTFYLYGDGTDDHAQLAVNGSGTIGLEAGLYEVVEEETQARFDLEVLDGENTLLVVNNPMPEDGEVPGAPDDGDTGDDAADDGKDADKDAAKDVTKLPSTGSGAADGMGLLTIAATAAAAISAAGALSLRKER